MKVSANPTYPFIRYEGSLFDSYENSCGEGVEGPVRLHVFALGETSAQIIAAAVADAVASTGGFQSIDWTRTQFIMDDQEADIWHSIVDFSVVHTA